MVPGPRSIVASLALIWLQLTESQADSHVTQDLCHIQSHFVSSLGESITDAHPVTQDEEEGEEEDIEEEEDEEEEEDNDDEEDEERRREKRMKEMKMRKPSALVQ